MVLISLCFSALIYFILKNSIEISFDVIEVNFIITAHPAPLTRNKRQLTEDGWMDITSLFSCHQNESVLSISECSQLFSVETVGSLLWVTSYSYTFVSIPHFQIFPFNYIHSVMGSHWKGHTLALILSVASLESFLLRFMTKMYFIVFKTLSYPEMNQSFLSIAFKTFKGK